MKDLVFAHMCMHMHTHSIKNFPRPKVKCLIYNPAVVLLFFFNKVEYIGPVSDNPHI